MIGSCSLATAREGATTPRKKDQEKDAAEFGAELLLPSEGALLAARKQKSNEHAADHFNVSVQLAKWRMDATGARILAARILDKWGKR